MPKEYYNLTDKGNELMEMLQPELDNSRLRKVIDYEVSFALRSYEMGIEEKEKKIAEKDKELSKKEKKIAEKDKELSEKEKKIAEKDKELSEKEKEIKYLEKLLIDNNIDY